MYDGTLSADWKAMVVFQQLIVLADSEGIIDSTPPAISRRTGIPLEIIDHGIAKLEEPDPYSRSAECEGRRITRLDDHRPWGWLIVNYNFYRDLASREDQRVQARERKRRQRDREAQATDGEGKGNGVTPCHAPSRESRHAYADVNADESKNAIAIPLQGKSKFYPTSEDLEQWRKTYPRLDVPDQLRRIAAWNTANEGKRKTARGIRRHINGWLDSENEKRKANGGDSESRVVMLDDD